MKKIILMFMILLMMVSLVNGLDENTANEINFRDTPTSLLDKFLSLFTGGWLVEPPGSGCNLITAKTTSCKSYEDSQDRYVYSTTNPDLVQWAFTAYSDSSCTNIYSTVSSGTYEGNGNSGYHQAPYAGKYYAFRYEKYDCGGSPTPPDCNDFQYDCSESTNVIYVYECGEYKELGECPSGTQCDSSKRLETSTSRGISFLKDRMCEEELICDPDDIYKQYCVGNKLYNDCDTLIYDCGAVGDTCDFEGGFYHCISGGETCSQAGGICKSNPCNTYSGCSQLAGACTLGYCCTGTCSTKPTPNGKTVCTDTDTGIKFEIKGRTYISEGTCLGVLCNENDKCVKNILVEYYCENSYVKSTKKDCSKEQMICGGGICIKEENTRICYGCAGWDKSMLDEVNIPLTKDCPKDYSEEKPTQCISTTTSSLLSLTEEEYTKAVRDKEYNLIVQSMCQKENDCPSKEGGYTIKCKKSTSIKKMNFDAVSEECNPTGALVRGLVCLGINIANAEFDFIPDGTCRAIREGEGTDFCFDFVTSFGKTISADALDKDACTYGWIAIAILFFIVIIVFSRLAG